MKLLFTAVLLMATASLLAAKNLEIYFIDVEGGQATLIVSPSGQSMLVDTGWAGFNNRDANRIADAAKLKNVRAELATLEAARAETLPSSPELDQLTADQRAAVALRYYQDLSVEETARVLKIPVDTAKSRLKTALRRLRELTGSEEAFA